MAKVLMPTCIFCIKPISKTENCAKAKDVLEKNNGCENKEVERFFNLATKYTCFFEDKENGNTKNFTKFCCVGCLEIVNSFNQLYLEMEGLKLKLDWKLARLKKRTEYANRVPSRFHRIKASSVLEDKSDLLQEMMKFRRDFVKSCSVHLSNSTPHVKLNRNETFSKTIKLPILELKSQNANKNTHQVKVEPVENYLEDDLISITNRPTECSDDVPMDFQYNFTDVKPFPNPPDKSPPTNLDTSSKTTATPKGTPKCDFKCAYCPSTFMKQDKLVRHTWYEHTSKGKRPGDQIIIPETFTTVGDWVNKTGAKFKCSEAACKNAIFMTEEGLQDHLKLHGSFSCKFCKEIKIFAPDLATHELDVHGVVKKSAKIKQCPRCDYKIPKHMPHESYLNHHLLKHQNLLMDCCRCPFCKQAFLSNVKRELMRSILIHWLNFHDDSNVNKSRFCGPRVGQVIKDGKRKKKKAAKVIHYCQQCTKSFPDVYKLKRHCFAIHKPSSDSENGMWNWKYECKLCGKKFLDKYVFERHQKTLHQKKSFVCQLCGVKSLNKKGLQQHNLRHHSKKLK